MGRPRAAAARAAVRRGVAALMLATELAACTPRADDGAAPVPPADMHDSRTALDWTGAYEGVLPCADCPGIRTRLVLHDDGRFELTTQYLDRQAAPQTATGRFTWDRAGSAIALDVAGSHQQFRVGEGRLLQLDADGSSPPWNTPHRVLTKAPDT